jgi:hypothetical protein
MRLKYGATCCFGVHSWDDIIILLFNRDLLYYPYLLLSALTTCPLLISSVAS